MNANETLRLRMKEERQRQNITLKEIAEIINVKEATVQRYESGEIKTVPYENVVSIAKALNTTPAYLMGWEEIKKNPDIIKNSISKTTVTAASLAVKMRNDKQAIKLLEYFYQLEESFKPVAIDLVKALVGMEKDSN